MAEARHPTGAAEASTLAASSAAAYRVTARKAMADGVQGGFQWRSPDPASSTKAPKRQAGMLSLRPHRKKERS